ncbi:hypothetical protein ACFC19_40325 [Streptomyces sp. NPDC056127]|uniref:hypothetical protein n=1 Tax=Streptomyces sp. NPDC056127 TaxID=3345720 RepID=UPI0035E031A6
MVLSGLGGGEVAESLVFAQAAVVVEGLDEGEDLGSGGGPVGRVRVPISSLSGARKLAAAALSKRDPVRSQLCRSVSFLVRSWNWAGVYSVP